MVSLRAKNDVLSGVKLLISGFEPFAGESLNPSMALLEVLARTRATIDDVCGVELHTVLLPVVRVVADELMVATIDELAPSHVLMFGEAAGRANITPERVAINVDDYRIADNAGAQPRGEAIVDDAPVGYFSTLPIHSMVAALHEQGLAASVSNSAGTYLCNRVFYRTMHHLATAERATRAGFVHLPYLQEQVHDKPQVTPCMSLTELTKAATLLINEIAESG
ncbi:MAG: pyroglutamyl-peptidase [Gammaproteobacteria bacterium]|jgi:pyroglutamyl-peptidase